MQLLHPAPQRFPFRNNHFCLEIQVHLGKTKRQKLFNPKEPAMKSFRLFTLAALAMIPLAAQQGPGPHGPQTPPAVSVQPATPEEIAALTYMREEEKLARDVYRLLFERWNYAAFDRISVAEQQHFASVGALLTRYSIPDPAATDTPGVFADPKLAAMYADLTAKGVRSLKDAIEVGVAIEQQDIADISTTIQTNKIDIKRVFANLLIASFNHLDAFESSLELIAALP